MKTRPLVEVDRLEKTILVRFNREVLDWDAAKLIGLELDQLVRATRPSRLRLNLGNVTLLTAAMLGRFLELDRTLRIAGGKLEIRGVRLPIYEVFRATHLTRLLDVRPALVQLRAEEQTCEEEGTLECDENRCFGGSFV